MTNKNQRRASGNMSSSWYHMQRPQPFPEHPAPGPSAPYNFYDRFGPEEPPAPPAFREGYPNEFPPPPPPPGSNFWRPPEREFFPPGTQSPDRFRPPQADGWQRPPAWKEPEVNPWPDRPAREPYTPHTPQWGRPPRDAASTRMFEPSDNWKQTHGERARSREHYFPSQPVSERYRPYSPPATNANRIRVPPINPLVNQPQQPQQPQQIQQTPQTQQIPQLQQTPPAQQSPPTPSNQSNQRSEPYRPSFTEVDHWVADEEPYESISRDYRAAAITTRSTTPDRKNRRKRGVDGKERSVSPVSPRNAQPSSPGFGSAAVAKQESPQLPHLEPLPRKPALPVRVPPGPKLHSRSPSYSSTSSSVNLPHIQPQPSLKAGLPPKPQFQAQPRLSIPTSQTPARVQTRSPPLQITSVGQLSPKSSSPTSSSREEPVRSTGASMSAPSLVSQSKPQSVARNNAYGNGRNNGRRSIFHNAPAFVPSTLAIDAPLMYPKRDSETASTSQAVKGADNATAVTDMDVSLPPTPAKPQELESESVLSPKSPRPTNATSDPPRATKGSRKGPDDEDAADASDMDMSPPPSPVLKVTTTDPQIPTSEDSVVPKLEPSRPSLAIDTSLSPLRLPHEVPRQSSSASPVPTTPEHAGETGADDSDMDMSSPTSETAPSPAARKSPLPASFSEKPAETSASVPPSPELVQKALGAPAEARADAAEVPLPSSPSAPPTVTGTPDPHPTPAPVASREVSVQVSPRLTAVAKLARPHVEAGELSPPASDKTLQGEAELTEKEHDAMASSRHKDVGPQDVAMDVDQPRAEKVYAEIPLSDALRMVAKLRFRHDPVTQEARVEPILVSNRQLAEPETPDEPMTPHAETLVQTVTENEQEQMAQGRYDGTKHSLRKRFAQHQAALAEKVSRLRKEYLALHEQWLSHCAKLDEVARASALEEAAATACRTTRRTAAMGDAVRSDLEMEQILASLGNEELTDANHLSAKNAAVIPDMVSVTKGRVEYVYDDTNNLVEDPHDFYKLETGIDDWTEEEKAIFIEKYAVHPKQFGFIADFLPNKTPAQCVTFYYLHKNTTIDFRKVIAEYNTVGKRRRSGRGKQKGNALLADILKHDDEVGRDGTSNSGRRKRGAPTTPVPSSTSTESIDPSKRTTASTSRRGTAQNTPDPTPTPDPEPAPSGKRPRRRANPSARAVAAMEQDNPEEPADEDARPAKRTRKARKSKAEVDDTDDGPSTPADTKPPEQPEPVVRKRVPGSGSSWSAEDKALFLKLLAQYGDDFKRIASSMPNKTTVQVSAFYRANVTEMQLNKVAALAPKRSPTPHENARHHNSNVIPGSGIMTPVMKRSTPGVENGASTSAASRSRSSGRMSPPPNPSGTQSSETDKRATSAAPHDPAAPSKPGPPSRPLQYQGGLAAAFAGTRNTLAESRAATSIAQTRPAPSVAQAPPPPPLRISFPSAMAYSNLSPSNFSGDPRAVARASVTRPGATPGATNPTLMEFSEFAPQPWQVPGVHPGLPRPTSMHPSATALGAAAPGLPAALETTDDLVRYLEHRTRLTAGQTNDSDFM